MFTNKIFVGTKKITTIRSMDLSVYKISMERVKQLLARRFRRNRKWGDCLNIGSVEFQKKRKF